MSKVVKKVQSDNEKGARRAVIEDLFYDLNASRVQIYKMNFVRGVFFGFGSVIGGTLVVALIIWLLTLLADIPGGIGDFIQFIVNTVQKSS